MRVSGSKAGDGAHDPPCKRIGNGNVIDRHVARVLHLESVDDLIAHGSVGRSVGRLRQGKPGSLNRLNSHTVGICYVIPVGILTRHCGDVHNFARVKVGLNNRIGHCQTVVRSTRHKAGDCAHKTSRKRIAHGNVFKGHIARVLHRKGVRDLFPRGGVSRHIGRLCQGKRRNNSKTLISTHVEA